MKSKISTAVLFFALTSLTQAQTPVLKEKEIEKAPAKPKAEKIVIQNTTPYVPGGVIVVDTPTQKKVKSAENTLVEIFLDSKGGLEKASGGLIEKDEFDPGQGMLNLKAAVAAAKKEGKEISGQWAFEKNERGNWIYEFEGKHEGKEVEILLNPRTGRVMSEETDDNEGEAE